MKGEKKFGPLFFYFFFISISERIRFIFPRTKSDNFRFYAFFFYFLDPSQLKGRSLMVQLLVGTF